MDFVSTGDILMKLGPSIANRVTYLRCMGQHFSHVEIHRFVLKLHLQNVKTNGRTFYFPMTLMNIDLLTPNEKEKKSCGLR